METKNCNSKSSKRDTEIALETALTHMVMEEKVYYGELSAMLWQIDEEALRKPLEWPTGLPEAIHKI